VEQQLAKLELSSGSIKLQRISSTYPFPSIYSVNYESNNKKSTTVAEVKVQQYTIVATVRRAVHSHLPQPNYKSTFVISSVEELKQYLQNTINDDSNSLSM